MDRLTDVMNRSHNGSKKWNRQYIEKRFGNVPEIIYPLFIADMDYEQAFEISQFVDDRFSERDFGYFDLQESYYQAIISWHQRRNGISLERDWLYPSVGTVSAMHFAASVVSNKRGILVLTPVYGVFETLATTFGKLHTLDLTSREGHYYLDMEAFEKRIQENDISLLLFCNPHNPSGKVWTKEELRQIVAVCKKYQVVIISDEVHSDFCDTTYPFNSLVNFFESYEQIIVSDSANKTFNLSGLNSSYLIVKNPQLLAAVRAEHEKFHVSVNRYGATYTEAAYTVGENWLVELQQTISNHLKLVQRMLKNQEIEIYYPESSYLIWMRLAKVHDVERFVKELAQATGVLVETGTRFVANNDGCIRLNVATSTDILRESLLKFQAFYEAY